MTAIDSASRMATVIVMNHNYARYLRDAVDSALAQTHPHTEVVVVDDASTDGSTSILASYGNRIRPVLLSTNVGQTAAFTAALQESTGDPILTLDADDVLLPSAVSTAVAMADEATVQVHWPLVETDENLRPTGCLCPRDPLPEGDLLERVLTGGPGSSLSVPTSGNAWSRSYLERVLPGPHEDFRVALDAYLFSLAPLFGHLRAAVEPQAMYRAHPASDSRRGSFDFQLDNHRRRHEVLLHEYTRWCSELGYEARPDVWRAQSWFHRLSEAVSELDVAIPAGTPFVLIDECQWNLPPDEQRRPRPFLERGGEWWGRPPDSLTAIRELERMRRDGVQFAVVAWPAFWWLDHYREFADWLRAGHPRPLDNDRVVVFDLRA